MSDDKRNTSVSLAMVGSGGAGVMTSGSLLLEAATKGGLYGLMTRTVGPQIRGGEAAALLRLADHPVRCMDDTFDILLAVDWKGAERFAAEVPLSSNSLIITDPAAGDIPEILLASGAAVVEIPVGALAGAIEGGRENMVILGIVSALIGLAEGTINKVITRKIASKGDAAVTASLDALHGGYQAAKEVTSPVTVSPSDSTGEGRWLISGNQAAGFGALRGGIRFVAAYPITPATEILEWMSPNLPKVGGTLVQAEDELASINMAIGASFGGKPSLTATSGPGLSLMMEGIGLAVASETPVVVVNVMRGGPSTGIPTKSEQTDLNIAIYGLHGDAPHIVTAATSVEDCIFTTQWSVHLAEALQTVAIVLSDQFMGQASAVIDPPANLSFMANRLVEKAPTEDYRRYAVTADGVSPMTLPGTKGGQYTADGLEHNPKGLPSTLMEDHRDQMAKRDRKLAEYNYGDHWADVEGDENSEFVLLTWGSTTNAVREAADRLKQQGYNCKLVAMRLLLPAVPEQFDETLKGAGRILVVEQSHSGQFLKLLRANYDMPGEVRSFRRAGPLIIRPGEIVDTVKNWRVQ
ncbi:2-oxoglutarate/2-oxoacid ferredoxin oxidoreductase, gamma subunit / 2-oxoglutarate/2-oxoacid ferredoxin oxidoreductase, alpha subunit [hydrothermal vent metagenome]|uniref:2-oxoglutarate/2-oxoacid ferredoxin oxidoreductase, gamma subunit / 2-oxoglutarate/2-oxoacid ferredoxin oxidoreductase, alpha subunit n=1 Tax=hydrothermal vent metagenome TaxID=652676 RepID=A0A3B0RVR4_9ZZZZ